MMRNFGSAPSFGYPNGHLHPSSWSLPQKAGAIASRYQAAGTSALTAAGAGGVNGEVTMAGSGALTADITYILFLDMELNVAGAGILAADGSYLAFVQGQVTMAGSGDLAAVGNLTKNGVLDLSGSGNMTLDGFVSHNIDVTMAGSSTLAANLKALGELVVTLQGSGSLAAGPRADGFMQVEMTAAVAEAVTPASVARAVWESLVADYQNLATMGGSTRFMYLLAHNKTVTDPVAGTFTIYADDGTTVLFQADLFENAAGTTPYAGQGADRRDSF
jgi:hypothetical protein